MLGHVQGVWYRKHARETAVALGLVGRVRNMPNGSVEAEVEGAEERIQDFLAWCRIGPTRARVDRVITESIPTRGYTSFEIDR
ncbi:MAG: acylphosphatase [Flavobacteriales bacterium]|nr:acylphosphatase [Flavobacteriales bacterium]